MKDREARAVINLLTQRQLQLWRMLDRVVALLEKKHPELATANEWEPDHFVQDLVTHPSPEKAEQYAKWWKRP